MSARPESPSVPPTDRQILRFLGSNLRPHLKWLIPSALFALGTVLTELRMTGWLPKKFIDEALVSKDMGMVYKCALALIVLFTLDGLADFFHRFFLRIAIERSVRGLRNRLFDRFLVFSQSQMESYSSGRAVNHVVSDVAAVSASIHVVADVLKEPLMVVGVLISLFWLNWELTMVCLVAIPLLSIAGKALGKSARRNQARMQQSLENLQNHMLESLGGIRTAHAFGQTPGLRAQFHRWTDEGYRYLIKLARIEELIGPITKLVTACVAALIIAFGGSMVFAGKLSPGGFVSFIVLAAQCIQPLRQLNQVNVRLQQVIAAGRRLYDVEFEPLDDVARAQERSLLGAAPPPLVPREKAGVELQFQDVFYQYSGRESEHVIEGERVWALEKVNLTIPSGRRIALVGRSGSGKSTLCSLALRFLDPSRGSVLLNGRAAQDYELSQFRAHFSWVSQDVFLFNQSIRENLKFANPAADDAALWLALERASLKDFVSGLPRKLDTVVGERASQLSGGEKQRMAIARAFLKDAPIVVLDEATSNLDAHSERAVQTAMAELMAHRSVIVIAHRLSIVREVDEVVVMGQGRILEQGSPAQLLEIEKGAFRALWESQRST